MIYFDNAATSKFKPKSVIDNMVECLINSANPGRSSHDDAIESAELVYDTRSNIKNYLGANDDFEVIFTKNTTEALNIAILGYLQQFKYKSHVITTMLEHNSVLRPLKELEKKGKIELTILPIEDGTINVPKIELYIRNNTRLIVLNHTSNVLGSTIDLEYASLISREYRIPLLLDTAQSIGHTRINLLKTPISMLAAPGHKGLCGPQGIGFLLFNKHEVTLRPLTFGGNGNNSNLLSPPIEYPDSFEVGTLNTPAIAGLNVAIDFSRDNFDKINSHINKLSNMLYSYLSSKANIVLYSKENSVLSFNVKGYTSSDIADYLNENGIAVRSGLHCAPLVHHFFNTLKEGMVRVSIGYNNTLEDIDALINCLDTIDTL